MKPRMLAVKPSELVILAIHNLEEKDGSSPQDIVRFISTQYGIESDQVKKHVEEALQRGLQFGILAEREGRFSLEEVPQPPPDTESASSQIPVETKPSEEVPKRRKSLRKRQAQKRKSSDDDNDGCVTVAKKPKNNSTKRKGGKRRTRKDRGSDEPPKPHRRSLRQR